MSQLIAKSRRDFYGNEITKQKKKQRVTFIDKAKHRKLAEIIEVKSLKNVLEFYSEGNSEKVKANCCCVIF